MRKFILLFSCAILLGCDKFVVFDYYLRGEFDAVYCYIPEKGIPCKKDTAISFSAEELVLLHLKKDSEGQNYGRIDYGIENIDGCSEDGTVIRCLSLFLIQKLLKIIRGRT